MSGHDVDVRCTGDRTSGWVCEVEVQADRAVVSNHRVSVRSPDLDRLAPGAADPVALVRASFVFLLARESPESILGTFDLPAIGRYFPEYETEIRTPR
jgi:hypothetical protein